MNIEQIKRAIDFLKRGRLVVGVRSGKSYYGENINTILQVLQSELKRLENKPLTFDELEERE